MLLRIRIQQMRNQSAITAVGVLHTTSPVYLVCTTAAQQQQSHTLVRQAKHEARNGYTAGVGRRYDTHTGATSSVVGGRGQGTRYYC